jgi:hypothetical protein
MLPGMTRAATNTKMEMPNNIGTMAINRRTM